MQTELRIGVIGAGEASKSGLDLARQVGQLLGEAGAILVCGGMSGIMEAASRGCREKGGLVVGILPGNSVHQANPYVQVPILTDMGHSRNIIIAQTSEALIAIEGEYGTLSEMAIALKLGKQVFALDSWPQLGEGVHVGSAEEAVGRALGAAKERRENGD